MMYEHISILKEDLSKNEIEKEIQKIFSRKQYKC